eukprot:6178935-Pleurochrysis_carterae.AAC.1
MLFAVQLFAVCRIRPCSQDSSRAVSGRNFLITATGPSTVAPVQSTQVVAVEPVLCEPCPLVSALNAAEDRRCSCRQKTLMAHFKLNQAVGKPPLISIKFIPYCAKTSRSI